MKSLFPFVLLLATAAAAQPPPAVEKRADGAAVPHTPADTLRALHNLFQSRRNTGGWLVGGSAFVTTVTGVGTLADGNGRNCGGYFCPDATDSALLIGIGTAPAWIPGAISLLRFSKRKEKAAAERYENTRKLPRYVQRKLGGRFFNTNYRFKQKN